MLSYNRFSRSPIPIDGHSSCESHNTTTHNSSETNATGGTPTSNGRTTAASIASGSRNSAATTQSGSSSNSTRSTTERISKYLIQYVPETPVRKMSSLKRVTG